MKSDGKKWKVKEKTKKRCWKDWISDGINKKVLERNEKVMEKTKISVGNKLKNTLDSKERKCFHAMISWHCQPHHHHYHHYHHLLPLCLLFQHELMILSLKFWTFSPFSSHPTPSKYVRLRDNTVFYLLFYNPVSGAPVFLYSCSLI